MKSLVSRKRSSHSLDGPRFIFLDFMLPHANDFPTFFLVVSGNFPITLPVSVDLRFPKSLLRRGKFEMFLASVPKTRVDKYDGFSFFQEQVRFTEPPESVFSVSIAFRPKDFLNETSIFEFLLLTVAIIRLRS